MLVVVVEGSVKWQLGHAYRHSSPPTYLFGDGPPVRQGVLSAGIVAYRSRQPFWGGSGILICQCLSFLANGDKAKPFREAKANLGAQHN